MNNKKMDMDELAKAFDAEYTAVDEDKKVIKDDVGGKKEEKMKKSRRSSGKKWPKILFFLGMITLIVGVVMLVMRFALTPGKADADFLVSSGEWAREDEPSVIWKFTEVGKGTLTTDNHATDYDFIWALQDGKLKIETSWLYNLNDEFSYSLDQGGKTLTLKNNQTEVKFKAKE